MGIYVGYGLIAVGGLAGGYLCRRKKGGLPLAKYLPVIGIAALLCLALAVLEGGDSGAVKELTRQELGDQQIPLLLDAEEMADKADYPVTVQEQKLTKKQKQELLEAAVEELEQQIFGENRETQVISGNLPLMDSLMGGRVQAAFTFWPGDVIDTEGVIHWEYFKQEEPLVQVHALLECQEEELIHEFYLQLERPPMSESESFYAALEEQLKQQNEKTGTKQFVLPTAVSGRELAWYQAAERSHYKPLLLGAAGVLVHYLAGKSKKERPKALLFKSGFLSRAWLRRGWRRPP